MEVNALQGRNGAIDSAFAQAWDPRQGVLGCSPKSSAIRRRKRTTKSGN
jgi:hypothetical protein